jgi:hypothetical protein
MTKEKGRRIVQDLEHILIDSMQLQDIMRYLND